MVETTPVIVVPAREPRDGLMSVPRRGVYHLAVMAVVYILLLVMLGVLAANYPEGHDVPYGLTANLWVHYRPSWRYPTLSIQPDVFSALFRTVLMSLWVLYAVVARRAARVSQTDQKAFLGTVAAGAIAFNALLSVWFPPVLCSDTFGYAMHGRFLLTGQNPYAEDAHITEDPPITDLTPWRTTGAEYGPVWAPFSALLASLGGASAFGAALAFRIFAAACNLVSAWLVYLIARQNGGNGALALSLYGWHPLLLIELAGSGHNDCLMVTLALFGVYLATIDKRVASWVMMILATLVKYLAGLLPLLYGAFWMARAAREKRLRAEIVALLIPGAVVLAVAYVPFMEGSAGIRGLLPGLGALVNRMADPQIGIAHSLLGQVIAAFAQDPIAGYRTLRWVLHAVFVVMVAVALWRAVGLGVSQRDIVAWCGSLTLAYVAVVYRASYPWYLVASVAMACAAHAGRGVSRPLLCSSAAAILHMIPYGILIPM